MKKEISGFQSLLSCQNEKSLRTMAQKCLFFWLVGISFLLATPDEICFAQEGSYFAQAKKDKDSRCRELGGICLDFCSSQCSGECVKGMCSGSGMRQCCVSKASEAKSKPQSQVSSPTESRQVFSSERSYGRPQSQSVPTLHESSFASSCPGKGCWEIGLITEWFFVKVTGLVEGNAKMLRFSPTGGYFLTDNIELAFAPSFVVGSLRDLDLWAFALPVGAIFNFEIQRDLYFAFTPFLGFIHGEAESYSGNGFTLGVLFGIRYRLYKNLLMNAGLSVLWIYLDFDFGNENIYYFAPDIGISYMF